MDGYTCTFVFQIKQRTDIDDSKSFLSKIKSKYVITY